MQRALLFALAGAASFSYWFVVRPAAAMTDAMTEWPQVLAFTAVLLLIALALPVYGQMLGEGLAPAAFLVAGAGIGLASVANVLEDGLHLGWAFLPFVVGELTMLVALLVATVSIITVARGRERLRALIPVGTVAGVALFVWAGGPVLVVTWMAAAAWALTRAGIKRAPAQPRAS